MCGLRGGSEIEQGWVQRLWQERACATGVLDVGQACAKDRTEFGGWVKAMFVGTCSVTTTLCKGGQPACP